MSIISNLGLRFNAILNREFESSLSLFKSSAVLVIVRIYIMFKILSNTRVLRNRLRDHDAIHR